MYARKCGSEPEEDKIRHRKQWISAQRSVNEDARMTVEQARIVGSGN